MGSDRKLLLLAATLMGITTPYAASAAQPCAEPSATLLVTGTAGRVWQHHRTRRWILKYC
jgi:hypothetical protein